MYVYYKKKKTVFMTNQLYKSQNPNFLYNVNIFREIWRRQFPSTDQHWRWNQVSSQHAIVCRPFSARCSSTRTVHYVSRQMVYLKTDNSTNLNVYTLKFKLMHGCIFPILVSVVIPLSSALLPKMNKFIRYLLSFLLATNSTSTYLPVV